MSKIHMYQENQKPKVVVFIFGLTIIINSFLFYYIYQGYTGINNIDNTWKNNAVYSINNVSMLAELERELGYVGFIHHFKNYVIRHDEYHFTAALNGYSRASKAITNLKISSHSVSDHELLDKVQFTLDEYHKKLLLLKNRTDNSSVKNLDILVKVDDSIAEKSLISLRNELLSQLGEQIQYTNIQVSTQKKNALILGLALVPLLFLSTLIMLNLVNKLSKITDEYVRLFNLSPDGIIVINNEGKILKFNPLICKMFGYSQKELLGRMIEDLIDPAIRKSHSRYRTEFSSIEQSRSMRSLGSSIKGITKSGNSIELSIAISSKKVDGEMHSMCVLRDISEHNELKEQAAHDHLTNVYNRRTLETLIEKELHRSDRLNINMSLLLIDIDNFKAINDNLGHVAGDQAIYRISSHLKEHIRPYDHLGRWGGDEFIIACPELNQDDAITFANRIRTELSTKQQHLDYSITLSIGIANRVFGTKTSYKPLLEQADKALYIAKENGRNQCVHFNQIS